VFASCPRLANSVWQAARGERRADVATFIAALLTKSPVKAGWTAK
jgi:hypothetical protein